MASIGRDQAGEAAFNEFYQRYKGFVLKVCLQSCHGFIEGDSLARDVFQNTFLKVYHKAYSFKSKEPDKTNISGDVKAWLSRIARNELINFLRKNPDEKFLDGRKRIDIVDFNQPVASEEDRAISSDISEPEPTMQMETLKAGLALLTGAEREVLMTYMTWYDPTSPKRHLPEEILKRLSGLLKVKAATIRQIKFRALKKLRAFKVKKEGNNL